MTESMFPDVPPPIPAEADRKARRLVIVSVASAVLILVALVCVRIWVLQPFSIASRGMYPTAKPGKMVVVCKLAYASASDVKRGDLVAYRIKVGGFDEVYFHRVIGIPGDRISTNAFEVILNGERVPQKYLSDVREDGALMSLFEEKLGDRQYVIAVGRSGSAAQAKQFSGAITVPADCFFVMGDNRTNSADSRHTGFVKFPDVVGRKF